MKAWLAWVKAWLAWAWWALAYRGFCMGCDRPIWRWDRRHYTRRHPEHVARWRQLVERGRVDHLDRWPW